MCNIYINYIRSVMIISFYCGFICAFAVSKVSLQETVEAVIGGSVVLPCSSSEHDLQLQDTDVLWRHNDSEIVYNLIKGQDSVIGQNPRYLNRVKTFPDEYPRGNFSLKLINIIHADAGAFSCIITHLSEPQTLQLIINELTAEKGKNSTEHGNQRPESSPEQLKIWICISIPALIVVGLIVYLIIRFRKKTSSALYREQRQSES